MWFSTASADNCILPLSWAQFFLPTEDWWGNNHFGNLFGSEIMLMVCHRSRYNTVWIPVWSVSGHWISLQTESFSSLPSALWVATLGVILLGLCFGLSSLFCSPSPPHLQCYIANNKHLVLLYPTHSPVLCSCTKRGKYWGFFLISIYLQFKLL